MLVYCSDEINNKRYGSESPSDGSDERHHPQQFDNLAYDNVQKRPGAMSSFQPSAAANVYVDDSAYPSKMMDMTAEEPATKL